MHVSLNILFCLVLSAIKTVYVVCKLLAQHYISQICPCCICVSRFMDFHGRMNEYSPCEVNAPPESGPFVLPAFSAMNKWPWGTFPTHHVGGSLGRGFKLDHGLSVSHRNKFSRMCGVQKEPPQDVPQRCAHSFELTAQEKLLPLNHLEERRS